MEQAPITVEQPLRYVTDTMGLPQATAIDEGLNENTMYNSSYLQSKPGTYKLDPKLTPWTRDGALAELRDSAPELPTETKPKDTLEDKLKFLIEADPINANQWTTYLTRVQQYKLHAEKYPLTEQMKATGIRTCKI